jgi:hypothetical protein
MKVGAVRRARNRAHTRNRFLLTFNSRLLGENLMDRNR